MGPYPTYCIPPTLSTEEIGNILPCVYRKQSSLLMATWNFRWKSSASINYPLSLGIQVFPALFVCFECLVRTWISFRGWEIIDVDSRR